MVNNGCFISYRRATSAFVARAVFQDLRAHQIDAFLDVEAIDEGDFRTVIDSQIRARPYFLPIFSPSALRRCREPADLLCKEFATAVESDRRIVPLVTTEFDRTEISECLPEPLATTYLAFNTVTVDHEYFDAAMDKLRNRFLKPVDMARPPVDAAIAYEADRLAELAVAQVPIGKAGLGAQRHFERAFAAVGSQPELAKTEFGMGAELLKGAPEASSLLEDFDLTFLELQAQLQRDSATYTLLSNLMKTKHDAVKRAITSVR
jgi:hypothetical protein